MVTSIPVAIIVRPVVSLVMMAPMERMSLFLPVIIFVCMLPVLVSLLITVRVVLTMDAFAMMRWVAAPRLGA